MALVKRAIATERHVVVREHDGACVALPLLPQEAHGLGTGLLLPVARRDEARIERDVELGQDLGVHLEPALRLLVLLGPAHEGDSSITMVGDQVAQALAKAGGIFDADAGAARERHGDADERQRTVAQAVLGQRNGADVIADGAGQDDEPPELVGVDHLEHPVALEPDAPRRADDPAGEAVKADPGRAGGPPDA